MTFYEAFKKEKEREPNYGTYITLCKVLQESEATYEECEKYFTEMMGKDEYDKADKKQMIDYLFEKANEVDL